MNTNVSSRFANSLASQIENFYAWVYLMVLGTAGRLLWVFKTHHDLDAPVSFADWGRFFHTGVRYDSVVMTYLMLPLIALAGLLVFAPAQRSHLRWLRTGWVSVLSFVIPVLAFASVVYYEIYNKVFDEFVFEFFEAGNAQDVVTIAYTDYGLIPKSIASLIAGLFFFATYRKLADRTVEFSAGLQRMASQRTFQVLCSVAIVAFIALGLRGRIGSRPLQKVHSGVTPHRILNMGTLNPIYNLKAAAVFRANTADYFAETRLIPSATLSRQAELISATIDASLEEASDSTDYPGDFSFCKWQRTASGPASVKPSHVFVLFLESYDSWPFLEKYRELGLVENGRQLGAEGHLLLTNIPGANSSLTSSFVCLQGLYGTSRAIQNSLPTSLVHAFQQLGYTTRSVNSFTSGWNDAERIAREQGFDEIYCTANIKPGGETVNLQVHDRTLYEFTSEKLTYDQPTLSFIRSSSYHGPWEVDLAAEDCEIPPLSEKICVPNMRNERSLRVAYGHLKYSDKMAGEFVRKMIERFPDALFVITGDHHGRHFISSDPPVYEGASVPLILYGPQVLEGTTVPENMAASHADIIATLVELCAPKGFKYASIGKSVLAPCRNPVGVGEGYVIFPQSIVSLHGSPRCVPLPWLTNEVLSETEKRTQIQRAQELHDAYYGVSYMLTRRYLEQSSNQVAYKSAPSNRY